MKAKRGFACMDPETRRQIASAGGKSAHARGKAHQFTSEEARQAGRKGGKVCQERGKAHHFDSDRARQAGHKGGLAISVDRAHMAEIGRKGRIARWNGYRQGREGAAPFPGKDGVELPPMTASATM